MRLADLLTALETQPFRPFEIELTSGTRILIRHPEDVFLLPSREKILMIQIYYPEAERFSIIWPEGLVALHWNGGGD